MKYIIDVPNQDYSYDEMLHTLKLKFYDDNLSCEVILDAEPYTEPDRKAIEDEVWEFYKTISNMKIHEQESAFGTSSWWSVINTYSYQEVKSKYEAWLKQKDEIHVGDEVVFEMAFGNGLDNNMKAVVLDQAAKGEEWCVLTENGCVETHDEEDLCKTGRHFPEVAELLEKMRGEEE